MSRDPGVVRACRALTRLYPRRFRNEYGADIVAFVRASSEDDPAWRVWTRLLTDSAISIPTQHLEVLMHRTPRQSVPIIYTAIAGAGVVLALVGGSNIAMVVIGLAVALSAGATAIVAWRRVTPLGGTIQTDAWWKFLLAGPLVIGAVIVAAGLGVEEWTVGIITVFLGVILTGVGLLMGLIRLVTRRPPVLPA